MKIQIIKIKNESGDIKVSAQTSLCAFSECLFQHHGIAYSFDSGTITNFAANVEYGNGLICTEYTSFSCFNSWPDTTVEWPCEGGISCVATHCRAGVISSGTRCIL